MAGNVPAMDRPSIAFARFLDSMVIEADETKAVSTDRLLLTCALCGDTVCEVEPADTLRVLLNTALAHDCKV